MAALLMTQAPRNKVQNLTKVDTPSTSSSIDTISEIRAILFGEMMSEYERRFTLLEENLAMGIQRLQTTLEGKVANTLNELEKERTTRESEHKSLVTKLNSHADELQTEQKRLTQQIATDILSVRDDLHEHNRSIEQKLSQSQGDLSTYLRELADKIDNGQ